MGTRSTLRCAALSNEHLNQHTLSFAQDADRFLQHLDISVVDYWIGTSMGALIGIHLCESFPGRIRNLILNDVGIIVPKDGLNRLAEYVGANPAVRPF